MFEAVCQINDTLSCQEKEGGNAENTSSTGIYGAFDLMPSEKA